MTKKEPESLHGMMAEFDSAGALLQAVGKCRDAGFTRLEAYSPVPVEGLSQALGQKRSRLSVIVFLAGLCGGAGGFLMQYWTTVVAYPFNVGGKPLNSWPAFMPIMFEMTVLFAAVAAVVGMFALNGLPMPYHPVFNVKRFCETASRDAYFLCIESDDPKFDISKLESFLKRLQPRGVYEVSE